MLTIAEARRLAISATGLGEARPADAVTFRHLRRVVSQVGVVQLDSVNAVARAHELLFFSRVGPYAKQRLHDLVYRRRELYEGWHHAASLIPTEQWPLLAWKRQRSLERSWKDWHVANAAVIDDVRALLRERGPLASSDVNHLGPRKGQWWSWSAGKSAIEWLFAAGEVGVTARRGAFERVYDLIERVMPADVLAAPPVPEAESCEQLALDAVRHLGVGTLSDIADYHRVSVALARTATQALVARGELTETRVEGWKERAYVLPTTTVPRRGCPDTRLMSPFDPLVWYRPRNVRLFDFDYTIEIYTPEAKRRFGYYVLPVLQGERIVGRVDVRSDRRAGVLRVPGAFTEAGADVDLDGVLAELWLLASWQGCADVAIAANGDLGTRLRRAAGLPRVRA